ncbi:cytochrome P450 family protein [Dictyostelium purpureum]|uniref:Cytochrome P450 family protein n=1 Tax=Dictyostelium purpureum TaxID=5786 RepID=F0ZBQ7_DICPU|nr:cytochrome P450 family protein [Dictyostelium purpureum]EGC38662.1 cytochrome P450 family protein [Dictyostelium purpureum]|eukprot:XP_003284855.1 cytochrome P450 family protein [Dictyostelium purpureum]
MIGTIAIVVIALLVIFVFKKQPSNIPPIVETIPFIGCFIQFAKNPLKLVRDSYDRLGDIFTLHLMGFKMTFLVGPEAQAVFFRGTDEELSPKEAYRFVIPVFGKGVVYDSETEIMYEQLRFVKNGLVLSQLKKAVGIIAEETEKYFEMKWGDSGEIDLLYEMNKLTILTASRCLMGKSINKSLGQSGELADLYHELEEGLNPISFFFPNLPLPSFKKRDAARAKVAAIFHSIIQERRKSTDDSVDDVLYTLMNSKYKDGTILEDEQIVGLMIGLLFAGQHTSSITLTYSIFYMLNNLEYYDEVMKDIKDIVQDENQGEINFDALKRMNRLETVIREVLRLHPPLIFLMRKVMEPMEYKGKTIQKVTSLLFLHNSFNPRRFDVEDKTPFSFIAFGGGKHGCPGENFGILQIKTIWTILSQKYNLELGPVPPTDFTSLVAGPKGPCMVKYSRKQKK